jgi:hypothetical protein
MHVSMPFLQWKKRGKGEGVLKEEKGDPRESTLNREPNPYSDG